MFSWISIAGLKIYCTWLQKRHNRLLVKGLGWSQVWEYWRPSCFRHDECGTCMAMQGVWHAPSWYEERGWTWRESYVWRVTNLLFVLLCAYGESITYHRFDETVDQWERFFILHYCKFCLMATFLRSHKSRINSPSKVWFPSPRFVGSCSDIAHVWLMFTHHISRL